MTTPPRLGIVGAGRVGLALARHAINCGWTLAWAVDHAVNPDTLRMAGLDCIVASSCDALPREAIDLCIIAVNDEDIETVARQLAASSLLPAGSLAFHTSGMRTSSDLQALEASGVVAGSLHPIQSFSDPGGRTSVVGIGCGVEGSDEFCQRAFELAEAFGWRPLRIATERKALYHAACVFAGNFTTVLAAQADELLRAASIGKTQTALPWILPMMQTVVDRLAVYSPRETLTGPAARGQTEVMLSHIEKLTTLSPALADAYRAMSIAAAGLAQSDASALDSIKQAINADCDKK